jgi:hypothetical protein
MQIADLLVDGAGDDINSVPFCNKLAIGSMQFAI